MRVPSSIAATVEKAAELGPHPLQLCASIVVAATVTVVTTAAIDGTTVPWVLLALALTALTVARPDSVAPLLLIVVLLGQWYAGVSPGRPQWALVPALSVLVIHAAAARASVMPVRAEVDGAATRRWLQHVALVAALTATLWALTVLFDRGAHTGAVIVSATSVVLVVALALVLYLREVKPPRDTQRSSTT
jgi:hypothetical protein